MEKQQTTFHTILLGTKKTPYSGRKLKKNKLFFLVAIVLTLFLLSTSTSVSAVVAGVNITPDTINLGDPISIYIKPYTDLYAFVLVGGPLDEDLHLLPDFHLHCLLVNDHPIIFLTEGGEFTFIYPTSGSTEGLSYTWIDTMYYIGYEDEPAEANTDLPGLYVVIVAMLDEPIKMSDSEAALKDVSQSSDFSIIKEYLVKNYETFIQFTGTRIFAIPEIPLGTVAALASPFLILGCLRIYKRRRRG